MVNFNVNRFLLRRNDKPCVIRENSCEICV